MVGDRAQGSDVAVGLGQQQRAFDHGERDGGQLFGAFGVDAFGAQVFRDGHPPGFEPVRAGGSDRFAVGGVERDRGQRAGASEIGFDEIGGQYVGDGIDVAVVEDVREPLAQLLARLVEGLGGELFLAAGEMEIQRALGRAARGDQLVESGGVIAPGCGRDRRRRR